jgi:hypothetical protein
MYRKASQGDVAGRGLAGKEVTEMLDPRLETVRLTVFTLLIGVVLFGGTTLTYFLAKRRPDPPNHVPAQRLHERAKATVTGDNMDAPRDKAA